MRSSRIVLVVGWLIVTMAGWMPRARAEETTGDLDTLVAPIALYADALVADILPASTYPVQVVEASRALEQDGHVDPSQASQWDPSIQALLGFPSVLAMMNDRIEWTSQLGEAVAEDQAAVLTAVQRVRAEAQKAGNLQSNDKQTVAVQGTDIVIQPTDPRVIYVPQYDPVAILYPPPPWGYYPAVYGVVGFGAGIPIDAFDPFYGIGWGFGPGFCCGSVIVINHHHDHDHDHYDHGHDGHWGQAGGTAWRPPSRESVGHAGGMVRGIHGGGDFGRSGGGFGGHDGGIPNRGMGGTAGAREIGGFSAGVPVRGGAFDHVGGGGWIARGNSARGAHSFGDGFGGGGLSHAGVGRGGLSHAGVGRGFGGAGMGVSHPGGFYGGGGFHGGGFVGGGHGGGGGGHR